LTPGNLLQFETFLTTDLEVTDCDAGQIVVLKTRMTSQP
jgi:hypothetical protein